MKTRRQFLLDAGKAGVGLIGLQLASGCETIDVESKVEGQRANFLTAQRDGEWYWQSGNGLSKDEAPEIAPEDWSMRVETDGLSRQVDETIDFQRLMEMEARGDDARYIKTMRCVFGQNIGTLTDSLVSTGVFRGIPLYVVLEELGVPRGAAKVRTFGADGFESNISAERAFGTGPDPAPVLLAYELNGQPLSRLRGGPVRLVIPEMWGYKNMKWLERLVVTEDDSYFGTYETERFGGTPEQEIIDDPGEIALMSVITKPTVSEATVEGPDITVSGTSFGGGVHIERVQLALDDGPFEDVSLPSPDEVRRSLPEPRRESFERALEETPTWPPPNVWMTWSKPYRGLATGDHTLTVRASDSSGREQSSTTDNRLKVADEVTLSFSVE